MAESTAFRWPDCLPPPLRGEERGTWAHDAVVRRLPEIARRVLAENDLHPEAQRAVEALMAEIPLGSIRALQDPGAPDIGAWEVYVEPYLGADWLQVPWFFAETYFYRRILEATGYFRPGPGLGKDPFRLQKERGLAQGLAYGARLLEAEASADLGRLLFLDLWSNQADLSLWPAEKGGRAETGAEEELQARLLVDDRPRVVQHWQARRGTPRRAHLILDNVGVELVVDLVLTDRLLAESGVEMLVLHPKAHPTFVSDATAGDVRETVEAMVAADGALREMGRRLRIARDSGRLSEQVSFFWTSPLAMWEMPDDLRGVLAASDLVVLKGDANYRRLLGDRKWPFDTPLEAILGYFPAPLLALRTLKAELAAGIPEEAVRNASREDPDWLTDGRWGMIQYWPGPEGHIGEAFLT